MTKILTIVVPAYNMQGLLARCLASFRIPDALMEKIEVIVVNDGSKDETSAVAHKFAEEQPGVYRVIDKENGNYGSCVERGLKEAKGKYIKTVDADDWVNTANFAKYVAYMLSVAGSADGPDLILNDFEFVDEARNITTRKSYKFVQEPGFTVAGFTYNDGRDLWMHAVAYKTEKLRLIGYTQMHGVSYTDEEWISLPVTTVETIGYFPDVVYEYLLGRQGQTCAPDEYLKGFWMQVSILKKLVHQYVVRQEQWGRDQKTYMTSHLSHRLDLTYRMYLLRKNKFLDETVLVDFDSYLCKQSRFLYDIADKFLLSRWYRFPFVRAWRRRRGKGMWFDMNIFAFRCMRKSVGMVKRIMHPRSAKGEK